MHVGHQESAERRVPFSRTCSDASETVVALEDSISKKNSVAKSPIVRIALRLQSAELHNRSETHFFLIWLSYVHVHYLFANPVSSFFIPRSVDFSKSFVVQCVWRHTSSSLFLWYQSFYSRLSVLFSPYQSTSSTTHPLIHSLTH